MFVAGRERTVIRWPLGVVLLALVLWVTACQRRLEQGVLHVVAPGAGHYEIYAIAGDATLQFVSEQVGQFNEDLALNPGSYLILADCSHQTVVIHPGETSRLIAHSVNFIPPHPAKDGDIFSIQCSRYEKSHLRQHISNRYSFHMVSGVKDLLVGMVPLKIDFQKDLAEADEPKTFHYQLSALRVAAWPTDGFHASPYFVSPQDGLLSITQAQSFGQWQFLLPGTYQIALNGTSMAVSLKANDAVTIEPAGLKVSTSPAVDLNLFSQIRGNPFFVEINDHHMLNVNTTYPVLPGMAKVRLDGSNHRSNVELKGGALTELHANSVRVDLGCSPWEWECLGKREVSLYMVDQHYPFLDSITDVPILYLDNEVEIGLEGSPGLRYHISPKEHDTVLEVGKVAIIPRPVHKPGYYTDLVRLEALQRPYVGHSYDITADATSTMTLIAGTYILARYTSLSTPENERTVVKQYVEVKPGQTTEIEVPFHLPEAKVKQLSKNFDAERDKRRFSQNLNDNLGARRLKVW